MSTGINLTDTRPLTARENEFVKYYVFSDKRGNGKEAVLAAFTCKEENAAAYAAVVLKRPAIQAAIARAQLAEVIPMSQFWMELKKAIEQDKSIQAKVAALRLKAEIAGLTQNKRATRKGAGAADPAVLEELAALIKKNEDYEESYAATK